MNQKSCKGHSVLKHIPRNRDSRICRTSPSLLPFKKNAEGYWGHVGILLDGAPRDHIYIRILRNRISGISLVFGLVTRM